jgi:hypothetical protein
MQLVEFIMCLLLIMPWVLTICWFVFTNRRDSALLVVAVAPWFLAMFALIGFHFIAKSDPDLNPSDPTFYEKGVGYGYVAVTYVGLTVAIIANILGAAVLALYHFVHRAYHRHTKSA